MTKVAVKFKEPTPQEIKNSRLYANWGLTDKEYQSIVSTILKRLPNYTETGLFAVMWSEHCSYKNSKAVLKKFQTCFAEIPDRRAASTARTWRRCGYRGYRRWSGSRF